MTGAPDLSEFFGRDDEPEQTCGNCTYFEGGGLTKQGRPYQFAGVCGLQKSNRHETDVLGKCDQFWPCIYRWPDFDHGD